MSDSQHRLAQGLPCDSFTRSTQFIDKLFGQPFDPASEQDAGRPRCRHEISLTRDGLGYCIKCDDWHDLDDFWAAADGEAKGPGSCPGQTLSATAL